MQTPQVSGVEEAAIDRRNSRRLDAADRRYRRAEHIDRRDRSGARFVAVRTDNIEFYEIDFSDSSSIDRSAIDAAISRLKSKYFGHCLSYNALIVPTSLCLVISLSAIAIVIVLLARQRRRSSLY